MLKLPNLKKLAIIILKIKISLSLFARLQVIVINQVFRRV